MNEDVKKCSHCGAAISPDALQGICPACLLAMNLSAPTELPDEPGPGGAQKVRPPQAPAPSLETVAKLFPQLELVELLGQGGMGAVFKARQPKLDRLVALKILLRRAEEPESDPAFRERFCREARALARLAHQDIVGVYDFGEAGGFHYLIMEYVDGLTLRQLLQRGRLSPEEALAIVPKICEALHFAHQQGVVHRDIKPENILITKQGQVKIADFGIAKIVDPEGNQPGLTGGKDVIGTPHYMAPEQIEQPARVDHRADIFSLGVVFYEMLTGELPIGKFRPPSQRVTVDVRLDEIVLRALEKEPDRRYQHVSQVKTAIETVSSEPAPGAQPRAGWTLKSKAPTIAAIGLGFASMIYFFAATQADRQAPVLLRLVAAAGFLVAAIRFGKSAWFAHARKTEPSHAPTPSQPTPAPLVLLSALMLLHGFYAFLETVLRNQPGLAVFPNVVCMVTGIGLLFLRQWARRLALAWVWVSYVLYVILALVLVRSQWSGGPDIKISLIGRTPGTDAEILLTAILFISGSLMVPWTHWLLTRERIRTLFQGASPMKPTNRSNRASAAGGIVIVLAILAWLAAAPRRADNTFSGVVLDAATGLPIKGALVKIARSDTGQFWPSRTDAEGRYWIRVPQDNAFLYKEDEIRPDAGLTASASADCYKEINLPLGEIICFSHQIAQDFRLKRSAPEPAAIKLEKPPAS